MLRLTDLREILRYIPQFRDRVFVIAMDGAIVEDENFANLLLDIALLRSLRIGVAIVHGAGQQIRRLAEREGVEVSNSDGVGITDLTTLEIAVRAANRVTHDILVGLSAVDQRGAAGNALIAHPAGILGGVDHLFTGKIERIDTPLIKNMLEHDIVPVIPPLGTDGEGHTYRLNSDSVAVDVARALQAVKLIYLGAHTTPRQEKRELRSLTLEEANALLKRKQEIFPIEAHSKLEAAVRAAKDGVPRVHIIDGRVQEGLLSEVFSNEGFGTLIHANEYQAIRKAMKKDIRMLMHLIQQGVDADELLKRSRTELERLIDDFFVFEVDGSAIACGAVHRYADAPRKMELACVYVAQRYENQGIGAKLIRYGEEFARQRGAEELICLSTQAINYFVQKGGFRLGTPDDLPPARREKYEKLGRRSQVLVKRL